MSYRTMRLELQGFVPELDAIQVGLRINRSYKTLLDLHPWSFLKKEALIATVAPYTTGTADVTQGSTDITGTGTAWTAAMAGRFIRVGVGGVQFYLISSVNVGLQTLTLNQAYSDTTATGQGYSIFQHRYSYPTQCKDILAMMYDSSLPRRTKTYLDNLDPERISTGQPVWWCPYDDTTFELWPVPDQVYTTRIFYNWDVPLLSAESDTPEIDEYVILAHARVEAYLQLATTEGGQRYQPLIEGATAIFGSYWSTALEEDMRKLSLPTKVVEDGIDFPQSNDYWMRHDPLDPRGGFN